MPDSQPGSVSITIATLGTPFIDQGNGTFQNATGGNSGTINYMTGSVTTDHDCRCMDMQRQLP